MGCPRHCGGCGRSPFGFGNLVPGKSRCESTGGDRSSGSPGCVRRDPKTNRADRRNHPAGKRTTIHNLPHLFAYEWLSEEGYFDIGAHVKQGQLLAVIETPEVDQQLEQARSNLLTAQANLELASITKTRYQGLLKSNAVSQQDVDNAVGTYNANKAVVEADKAAVEQYSALVSFEKIYAPFDGVITARNTDIGDLINSGSSSNVKTDLFHIAQPGKLRVYVNVPEEYSQGIKAGMTADLNLTEFPGRKFQGKLVRTAEAINLTTRTLLIEIDVDNPTGTLLTGSYAEVHLAVPTQASTFLLPVNALLFRSEGLRVAVVNGGKVTLSPVAPGHDFGNQIEIVSGLKPNDQVIVNPPDSIVSGQEVQIVQATLPGDAK